MSTSPSGAAFDRIVDKLIADGRKVSTRREGEVRAKCPAHNGQSDDSLSVRSTESRALIYCHGGCERHDVLDALGLTDADLFDEPRTSYPYTDPLGTVLRTVTRSYEGGKRKFRQEGQTRGVSTLYRLPDVLAASKAGMPVYLVEGEEDVHAVEALGATATTAPQGASNFHKVDAEPLRGAVVVAIVDKDAAGDKWAAAVKAKLDGVAAHVEFRRAKTGKDASDHLAAGGALHDLEPYEVQEEEQDVPLRRAHVTWAHLIEPEPVIWAWHDEAGGRIPSGSLSLAAGREGTGKSSFGIWLAAQITKGALPGAFAGRPRKVFYVAVEDSWKHTLIPRLMAAGADLSKVGRFEVVAGDDEELALSLPHDNALLEREVRFHEIALVVIDPLMSVIGERIDTHREREVRSALDPLAKMADRTGSVFLGIAHFNKGAGTDAASLITGSGAFKNVPRSVFGFARDESSETGGRVMSQVKNSLGRDDLPSLSYVIDGAEVATSKGLALTGKFSFTGESERSVADVLRESRGGEDEREERNEAAAWLTAYIGSEGGSCSAGEAIKAAAAVGIAKTTLTRARKAAGVRSDKTGMAGGWIWTIEESTEGTEESKNQTVVPSVPSVVPSAGTQRAGTPTGTAGTGFSWAVPAVPVAVPVADRPEIRPALVGTGSTPRAPSLGPDGRPQPCPECGHVFHRFTCSLKESA